MKVQSKRVWVGGQFTALGFEIQGDKFVRFFPYGTEPVDEDFGTDRILPGFLDVHTHGSYGYDTNDAKPEGLKMWMKKIPEEGVTSILPTTVTQMPEVLSAAVKSVADVAEGDYEGAEILGIHFEGPYLDMKYKGAQPPEAIAVPSVAQFKQYQEAARGWIKYITLSPEHDTDYALTRYCATHGVTVSMGHSGASYEQALLGVANGARTMTHCFNGMLGFNHRALGLAGAALRLRGLYGEMICDGHHVDPNAINIFFQAKGAYHAVMVTDSLRAKHCSPDSHFQLGGHDIEIRANGLAYLKGQNTIAGSTLAMNQGLRVLIEEAKVPEEAAINACTINPAACIGVNDRKGKLAAGFDADFTVLSDAYDVVETVARGKKVYTKA